MKYIIKENQYQLVKKILTEKVEKDNFGQFIRDELRKIYQPLNLWGKAPNPNNDCETNNGVINIFQHSDDDVWSMLNRFDTNNRVKSKIESIFLSENPEDKSLKSFMNWISENSSDLFGPKGQYTQSLVDLVVGTVESGNRNEKIAIDVLKNKFPTAEIKRYCSGDIRDTMKGMDISITSGNLTLHAQIKPFKKIISFIDADGDTFFEVNSPGFKHTKYKSKYVDFFIFVNQTTGEFAMFQNNKQKIADVSGNCRFYEPILYTNMTFTTKPKRKSKNVAGEFFGIESDKLKNIEYRLDQLNQLKKKYKG